MLSKLSWDDWQSEVRSGIETLLTTCTSPRKDAFSARPLFREKNRKKTSGIKTTISELRKQQELARQKLLEQAAEEEEDLSTAYGSDDEAEDDASSTSSMVGSPLNRSSTLALRTSRTSFCQERSFSSYASYRDDMMMQQKNNCSFLDGLVEHVLVNMSFLNAAVALGSVKGLLLGAAPPPPPMNSNNKVALKNNGQNQNNVALYQQNKEEEQFMELIFPGFQGDTFIWNVTLFQILFFGFTMMVGHNKANPTPCALYMLGASWGPAVARGQLWRLFCPMMLHANMMHLFFNVFFQLRIGFGMEKQFGKSKMRILYLACGVIGNLISVMLDPFKLAVGASTAGFGLIGVWIAEIVLSWEILGRNRDKTLIWILFMLVSVTTMSGMSPNMDLYGHFGGAFGGFLMAIIMADMREDARPPWYNTAKKLAMSAFVLLLAAGFGKIFFLTPIAPLPDCPTFFGLDTLYQNLPKLW